ncbi:hypothetical protein [Cohnella luojiensis]|uniref:Galactose mutarotase n=1 Tax=Cohnella luojiensis TaxID=652876 RepID=A0A4Y8M338_9BACL|nr:hypothetical protein [Cohnella luojiensis]TFE28616.1 hypothetical protein E2980_07255 [Cohnella luojiensis]
MGQGQWTKSNREGYPVWIGETEKISLCIVPGLGSKVVSLVNRSTNREWLWSSGKALGNEGYASAFSAGDESGWDEMFPGIIESTYPDEPWKGRRIPDHGEVWSMSWVDSCTETELRCKVEGVAFPYRLEKVYSFASENTVRIDYSLTNLSDSPFSFLWAAHPLLQVREGMKLNVPEGLEEIEVSYSEGQRLGEFQDKRSWPNATSCGGTVDLSVIGATDRSVAEKYYFTNKLTVGMAALSDPDTGESITLRFPEDKVPYLAIWANSGGYGGYYHFAIEPATGRMDDLNHAMNTNEAATVEGRGTYRWHLEVTLT